MRRYQTIETNTELTQKSDKDVDPDITTAFPMFKQLVKEAEHVKTWRTQNRSKVIVWR